MPIYKYMGSKCIPISIYKYKTHLHRLERLVGNEVVAAEPYIDDDICDVYTHVCIHIQYMYLYI